MSHEVTFLIAWLLSCINVNFLSCFNFARSISMLALMFLIVVVLLFICFFLFVLKTKKVDCDN